MKMLSIIALSVLMIHANAMNACEQQQYLMQREQNIELLRKRALAGQQAITDMIVNNAAEANAKRLAVIQYKKEMLSRMQQDNVIQNTPINVVVYNNYGAQAQSNVQNVNNQNNHVQQNAIPGANLPHVPHQAFKVENASSEQSNNEAREDARTVSELRKQIEVRDKIVAEMRSDIRPHRLLLAETLAEQISRLPLRQQTSHAEDSLGEQSDNKAIENVRSISELRKQLEVRDKIIAKLHPEVLLYEWLVAETRAQATSCLPCTALPHNEQKSS